MFHLFASLKLRSPKKQACCAEALPKRLLALTKVVCVCFCLTLYSIMCFQWSVLSQGWLSFTVVTVTDVCLRSALYATAFILNLCLEALRFLSSRDSVSRLCSTDTVSVWFRRLQIHGLVVSKEELCYIVCFVQIYFNDAFQLTCPVMKCNMEVTMMKRPTPCTVD